MKKPLINFVLPVLTTVASIIKDKRKDVQTPEKGMSVSSKRIMNVVGSGAIITIALSDIAANGINTNNLVLTGIGVIYCLGMSHLVAASEAQ
jgi:hypothetical protein